MRERGPNKVCVIDRLRLKWASIVSVRVRSSWLLSGWVRKEPVHTDMYTSVIV